MILGYINYSIVPESRSGQWFTQDGGRGIGREITKGHRKVLGVYTTI
jgi:hypothetical protein